jgi:hypothetical protein
MMTREVAEGLWGWCTRRRVASFSTVGVVARHGWRIGGIIGNSWVDGLAGLVESFAIGVVLGHYAVGCEGALADCPAASQVSAFGDSDGVSDWVPSQ